MNRKHVLLKQFHEKYGHEINETPTNVSSATRALRAKLVLTEALEFCRALGIEVWAPVFGDNRNKAQGAISITSLADENFEFAPYEESAIGRIRGAEVTAETAIDWVEAADAIADLHYVVVGSELTLGLDCDIVFDEVHRSNMSKGGAKDEHGKTLKGNAEYTPPQIAAILSAQYPEQAPLWEDDADIDTEKAS